MSKWMVDCKGEGGDAGNRQLQQVMDDHDFESFIEAHGGLASAVQKETEKHGYHITDRGGGSGSWHIGVPFDDLELAVIYLEFITDKFSAAIGAELLRVELKTWSSSEWRSQ